MDQAAALLSLQGADSSLQRLRKQLDNLPERRAILDARAKIREVETLGSKADLLVSKLQAELKARNDEIATLTEKIDAEQAKLMNTTDHRQVQALSREMDGLKRRRDKVEMETLEYEDRIAKANEQRQKVDAALGQLANREEGLVGRFKEVGGAIQQEIHSTEADRATLAGGLDADLLARYESTRESKGGIAVGRLLENTCSACHMALPAERLAELEAGDDISICPTCRRLIVVRIEEPGASES